jgi:hypothetical protein
MEEAEEGKGRSYGVEGAMAPSLLLPQQRVDVQMRVLAREEIRNGFPLGQVGSYPSALYGATPRTGRHQGLQAVQESGRPPSLCQRWIHHRVHRHEIVLRVNRCSRWSFRHVWHRSGLSHRISRLNSRQKMEAIALLAPTLKVLDTLGKK